MPSFYCAFLFALSLIGSVARSEPASPSKQVKAIYANAQEAFQDLLNALPEESLHAALNSLAHFKDGVFESDRRGVEHVHKDNPPLATKLIVAAVQDLKKRQTPSNGTSVAPPPPPSSSEQPPSTRVPPPPPSSEQPSSTRVPPPPPPSSSAGSPPVIVPVPVTTTDDNGRATVVSSAILSEPTASVAVPVTRVSEGRTQVVEETKPAVIFTATNEQGSAFVTTSAVNFAPTRGQVLTSVNEQGSTFLTTYTPGGGRVSSILLLTTTGGDGKPSVVTSYTFVEPAQQTGPEGNPEPTATQGKPGLQTGAASKNRIMDTAVVGGVLGAFAWLI